MAELTKDFLKFVVEVVLIVIVLVVLFSEEGIAANTFSYLTYVEPILLQNWLSTTLTVGSYAPGGFVTNTKTTGQAYTIKIYKENRIMYIVIEPPQEFYLKAKFATIEPTPFVSNCKIPEQEISLKRNVIQSIIVEKIFTDDGCSMNISAPAISTIVGPYRIP